jgi:hypothetical protein
MGTDVGASASLASGATSGNTGAKQISGGNSAGSMPPWAWLGLGAMAFVALVAGLWIWKNK